MTRRTATNHIVVHCAATRPGMDVGVREIRQWHIERGFGRIGYHIVIRRNGKIEYGCPINDVGIHVKGHNRDTVAVCMVGGIDDKLRPQNNFTPEQWVTLEAVLRDLQSKYPKATILGHRDFPKVFKACPSFAAIPWASARGLRTANVRPVMGALGATPTSHIEAEEDERDDDMFDEGDDRETGFGKWMTGLGGSAAASAVGGIAYGADWRAILVIGILTVAVVATGFYLMGYERRERLWDRLVGT